MFLVFINPHRGVQRLDLYKEFESAQASDPNLADGVAVQRTLKVIGRDEVYLIMRSTNLLFLEQALSPFQDRAQITVTPVVELI